jgi:hypothetical protein
MILGVSRLLVGIVAWVAPGWTAKFFGLGTDESARWVTRLFGARDFTIAASLLAAPPAALPTVAAVGATIDAVDAISGFDEARRGNLGTRAVILGPVGAVVLGAMGAAVARHALTDGATPAAAAGPS